MILILFLEVRRKLVYFLGSFGHFGALMRASGVPNVQLSIPGCRRDWIMQEIGSG